MLNYVNDISDNIGIKSVNATLDSLQMTQSYAGEPTQMSKCH